ncbi:unnamed protein product [Soboliphyme baturini]|uniref:Uncharacterized protein n=1 Tax=Soboliphyme baturini TaxID=241478 RepID=A0A183IGE1_9BILA|nr:unnamed protein product [Soboliphyme baturini]
MEPINESVESVQSKLLFAVDGSSLPVMANGQQGGHDNRRQPRQDPSGTMLSSKDSSDLSTPNGRTAASDLTAIGSCPIFTTRLLQLEKRLHSLEDQWGSLSAIRPSLLRKIAEQQYVLEAVLSWSGNDTVPGRLPKALLSRVPLCMCPSAPASIALCRNLLSPCDNLEPEEAANDGRRCDAKCPNGVRPQLIRFHLLPGEQKQRGRHPAVQFQFVTVNFPQEAATWVSSDVALHLSWHLPCPLDMSEGDARIARFAFHVVFLTSSVFAAPR